MVGLLDGTAVLLAAEPDPDTVLVVSTEPLVTGNRPVGERDAQDEYIKLSLVGQVPVQVSSAVAHGDVLVASPDADGTAVARSAADGDDHPVVGLALESAADGNQALALVGGTELDAPAARQGPDQAIRRELDRKDERIADLEAETDDLRSENEQLRERLAALEDQIAGVASDAGGAAAPAGD